MQWLPVSPTQTLIREISYALPDGRREMKAARYLNWRINRQVNAEDTELVARVQAGMASDSFTVGPLSDQELVTKLQEKGITIARRTVAKYREELGILPSNLRRDYK